MGDRLLKESDVMRIAFQLPYVVNSAFFDAVKALPSADRPEGAWRPFDRTWGREVWYCTVCETSMHMPTQMGKPMYDYCPYCGARMKGADDD